MLTDGILNFVAPPPSPALSLVLAAGASVPSTIIDITGSGVGTAPPNIIGTATLFGSDMFVGDKEKPQLAVVVGTAFTTSTSCTLNVQFQAAADSGSGGGYLPSTWNTLSETGYMGVTNLTKGATIMRFDWPPAFPANLSPRYFRLNFQTLAAASFTAGTIAYALVTMARDDYGVAYAAKNFVVA
jgi:hypothetical protein